MSDTLQAVKKALAVIHTDIYGHADDEDMTALAEGALRAASLADANVYTLSELERVLTGLGRATNAAIGSEGHLTHIRATQDALEEAQHVTQMLRLCSLLIGTLRHAMSGHDPEISLAHMTITVIEMLPKHQREAIQSFTSETELLLAEGPADLRTIDELMAIGMVSKVIAGGYVFMKLRPRGVEVWKAMQVPGMADAMEKTDAR